MAAVTPPTPSLVAILLVTQTRGGLSNIVFHYPPDPLNPDDPITQQSLKSKEGHYEDSSSDSDDDTPSEEDVQLPKKHAAVDQDRQERTAWNSLEDDDEATIRGKDTRDRQDECWEPAWEPLLGLGTDGLSAMLCPDRSWHKRRLEVGINDLCFLGWPVFARDDGTWRKHKTRRRSASDLDLPTSQSEGEAVEGAVESTPEAAEGQPQPRKKSSKSDLVMFNVVFVLDPPLLEYNLRVEEMYDNIVKKLTRALKWEQGHSDYVLKESETMMTISSNRRAQRSAPSTWYTDLLSASSLATALASVFTNISTSRIASVTFSPQVSISLQIPPATSTSVLPSLTDPPGQPGLWLTTANEPPALLDIDTTSPSLAISKHFTLLLKSSKARILKEVQATGGSLVAPMTKFINALNPTKSFHKISTTSKMSLQDITELSRHLIYWRRAIAVPPLNQRDTYIVSPNADMSKLKTSAKAYEAAFPNLPSLPQMLSKLSGEPRPWYFLIPSSDHKEAYYEVLAWLLRGGWVTQLRTRAFVRISPEIKKLAGEQEAALNAGAGGDTKTSSTPPIEASEPSSFSPDKVRPALPYRPSSDAKSTITVLTSTTPSTTTSISTSLPHHPHASHQHQTPSSTHSHTHHNTSKSLSDPTPNSSSLIPNPNRASPLEATWLAALHSSFITSPTYAHLTQAEREECHRHFPTFLRYFNGEEALERIPVREGLKRKVVWEVLGRMGLDFEGPVREEEAWDNDDDHDDDEEPDEEEEEGGGGDGGDGAGKWKGVHRETEKEEEEEEGGEKQSWLVTVRHW